MNRGSGAIQPNANGSSSTMRASTPSTLAEYSSARVGSTRSARPYATASSGVRNRSRSMSFITCSTSRPEWRAITSAYRRVSARISRAAIWMSAGVPRKPPEPWWIITFELGRTWRFPAAPPARIIAPADIAMPMQYVCTSGFTYCIAS